VVNLPNGADYNMESRNKKKSKLSYGDEPESPVSAIHRSDRELARIFVEMFKVLGEEKLKVIFDSDALLNEALELWGGGGWSTVSFEEGKGGGKSGRKNRKGNSRKGKGFAQILKEEMEEEDDSSSNSKADLVPIDTECCIIVSPSAKHFNKVKQIAESVGPSCLVIVLNARDDAFITKLYHEIDTTANNGGAFVNGYTLRGCSEKFVVHKRFNTPWILSTSPSSLKAPKTIFSGFEEDHWKEEDVLSEIENYRRKSGEGEEGSVGGEEFIDKLESTVDGFLKFFR